MFNGRAKRPIHLREQLTSFTWKWSLCMNHHSSLYLMLILTHRNVQEIRLFITYWLTPAMSFALEERESRWTPTTNTVKSKLHNFRDPSVIGEMSSILMALALRSELSLNFSALKWLFLRNRTLLKCCSGYCVDLLNKLANDIGFTYTLYKVRDEKWGLKTENGWNGLIADLMHNKADMCVTSLKVSEDYCDTLIIFRFPVKLGTSTRYWLFPSIFGYWNFNNCKNSKRSSISNCFSRTFWVFNMGYYSICLHPRGSNLDIFIRMGVTILIQYAKISPARYNFPFLRF